MTSSPEVGLRGSADAGGGPGRRRLYIDWARGIAVLIMIGAHVLDAWTAPGERSTKAFGVLNLVAGYAAPLFLWLAGVSLVLAGERSVSRGSGRRAASLALARRGAIVFGLAFLFRLQAFVVSPGNPPVSLLRVDILNIMGPSIMAAAIIWGLAGSTRVITASLGAVAVAIAMATPVVRSAAWIEPLPQVLQWYLTPAGNHSTFTLFPWSGFVFAGAAFGALLAAVPGEREGFAVARLGLAGLALAALSQFFANRPSIYAASSFWTTSPTYFGIRVAVMMLLLGLLHAAVPLALYVPRASQVLERFGRHSLFVYWIHVELVYGYATLPLHRRLPLWGTGVGFVLFSMAMYWAIALMKTAVQSWRSRQPGRPLPRTVRA